MLDEERAVVAERLGLDVVLDELPEARAAVDVGAAPLRLRTAEEPEPLRAPFEAETSSASCHRSGKSHHAARALDLIRRARRRSAARATSALRRAGGRGREARAVAALA